MTPCSSKALAGAPVSSFRLPNRANGRKSFPRANVLRAPVKIVALSVLSAVMQMMKARMLAPTLPNTAAMGSTMTVSACRKPARPSSDSSARLATR